MMLLLTEDENHSVCLIIMWKDLSDKQFKKSVFKLGKWRRLITVHQTDSGNSD